MSSNIELNVQPREAVGTGPARRLRRQGLVPAIVYGHGQTFPIAFSAKAFNNALGDHNPTGVLFTLKGTHNKSVTARIRDMQFEPTNLRRLIHADFQIVTHDEAVRANVPVITVGVPKGVKEFGGILDVVLHSIEVEGPAAQIPEAIEVDVSDLGINDHISVGALKLPKGLKAHTPADALVVTIEASRIERELAEAEAAPTTVEQQPELITRGKEEEAE